MSIRCKGCDTRLPTWAAINGFCDGCIEEDEE